MVLFGLAALVGLGLVVPAVFALPQISPRFNPGSGIPFVLLTGLLVLHAARGRAIDGRWVLGLLAASFGLRAAWVIAIDPALSGDFAAYWEIANRWAEQGVRLPVEGFYELRALPLYWPLASIFGGSSRTYQLANLVFLAVASFYVYRYADLRFGRANAQAAVLFCNLAPETYGAAGIATHDIPGTFLLCVLGLVVLWIDRLTARGGRLPVLLLASGVMALVLLLVHVQRLPWTLMVGALLLSVIVSVLVRLDGKRAGSADWRLIGSRVFFLVALPSLILISISPATRLVVGDARGDQESAEHEMAFLHDRTKASYRYKIEVVREHMANVSTDEKRSVARHLALSSWADDPYQRIRNLNRRSDILFDFGSNFWFYVPDDSRKLARNWYRGSAFGFARVLCLLLACLPMGLLYVSRRGGGAAGFPLTDWQLIFLSLFSLALVGVSEVQSRYLFPLYFLAAPWLLASAGRGVSALAGFALGERRLLGRLASDSLFVLGGLLVLFAAWLGGGLALDAAYGPGQGRIVSLISEYTLPSENLLLGEAGIRSRGTHEHADAFGPYDLWLARGAQPKTPAEFRRRICGLDPDSRWAARLYLERMSLGASPAATDRCRVGSPESQQACDLPEAHLLEPVEAGGLQATGAGCLDFLLVLEPREDAAGTPPQHHDLWRIALLRLVPESVRE